MLQIRRKDHNLPVFGFYVPNARAIQVLAPGIKVMVGIYSRVIETIQPIAPGKI